MHERVCIAISSQTIPCLIIKQTNICYLTSVTSLYKITSWERILFKSKAHNVKSTSFDNLKCRVLFSITIFSLFKKKVTK